MYCMQGEQHIEHGLTAGRIACFSISSATGVGLQTSIMALEEAEPAADQCGEECLFLIPPSLWNPAISIYISLSLITIR